MSIGLKSMLKSKWEVAYGHKGVPLYFGGC
jgi:hypothetical protein